ncbi:MAG: M48 family metalloprotease [Chlamydiales bacterium]|nr:M48 family metalloprotease [Chlamydiales bacterium]
MAAGVTEFRYGINAFCKVPFEIEKDFSPLYAAQAKAIEVVQKQWFPVYSAEYVDNWSLGLDEYCCADPLAQVTLAAADFAGRTILRLYLVTCHSVHFIVGTVSPIVTPVAEKVYQIAMLFLNPAFEGTVGSYFPVNVVNGQRHLLLIRRSFEKNVGENLLFPFLVLGKVESFSKLNSGELMSTKVQEVVGHLKEANPKLLNSDPSVQFEYPVEVYESRSINAFAAFGGHMVFYSELVKQIDHFINNQTNKQSTITFEDGSTVTVDLTGVTVDDVLAAVAGHEMTHVASGHTLVNMGIDFVLWSVSFVARLIREIQNEDSNSSEMALLDLFLIFERQLRDYFSSYRSRKDEYEADVTGAYLAKQAGYKAIGAIAAQEMLSRGYGDSLNFFHKHFEAWFGHPWGEHRKRALLAAIKEFAPEELDAAILTLKRAENHKYNENFLSPALKYARNEWPQMA